MPQLEPLTVRNQFPDYPIDALPDLSGFIDTSWHNDTCPSFRHGHHLVWVDWPDPREREDPEGYRFIICALDKEGRIIDGEPSFQTDDWSEVRAFIGLD